MNTKQNPIPTILYLDDKEKKEISLLATLSGKTEAEVRRDVLKEGLRAVRQQYGSSIQGLLELLGIFGEEDGLANDLSSKHNEYTWD